LATTIDYRVRFICPQWDYDRWVVLENLQLTLKEVMNAFWVYECPAHGILCSMPFQGEVKKVFPRPSNN
jgi:hypothetical protein